MKNTDIMNIEKIWDLKTEAHNDMFNYLESKGLDEAELLQFLELLKEYSNKIIKLNSLYLIM